jgi:hypothetical protein
MIVITNNKTAQGQNSMENCLAYATDGKNTTLSLTPSKFSYIMLRVFLPVYNLVASILAALGIQPHNEV